MNELLKTLASLSVSGSLLILLLLLGKKLYQNWLSRRWQYFIWLVVIARLLLPFGREDSPMDQLFRQPQQIQVEQQADGHRTVDIEIPPAAQPAGRQLNRPITAAGLVSLAWQYLWLIWLLMALALLVSRVAGYRSFVRYLRAGRQQVSDIALLDALALEGQQLGVTRRVELYTHGLISSPLLVGVLRPCILLPEGIFSVQDFRCIVRHELVHYRHRDALIKWLAQLALCVHWFNPLVWWMCRQLDQACELACDEGATQQLDQAGRQAYGDALMRALSVGGQMPVPPSTIALHRSAALLQQRLHVLMNSRKPSKKIRFLSFSLALVLMTGTAAAGAYAGPAQAAETPAFSLSQLIGQLMGRIAVTGPRQQKQEQEQEKQQKVPQSQDGQTASAQAEKFYQADSLPLFQAAFARLDAKEQQTWLDRIYREGRIAYWSVVIRLLDEDSTLLQHYAEKAYADDRIDYFSVLAVYMREEQLEQWLDRALEDKNMAFQSALYYILDQGDLFDQMKKVQEKEQEKEWERAQEAAYQAVGVTMDGKDYYYQGQLVNIFLDIRPNKSFYTLNMNPKGTVNLKILRNQQNEITGTALMTEEEVTELLGDMEDGD